MLLTGLLLINRSGQLAHQEAVAQALAMIEDALYLDPARRAEEDLDRTYSKVNE